MTNPWVIILAFLICRPILLCTSHSLFLLLNKLASPSANPISLSLSLSLGTTSSVFVIKLDVLLSSPFIYFLFWLLVKLRKAQNYSLPLTASLHVSLFVLESLSLSFFFPFRCLSLFVAFLVSLSYTLTVLFSMSICLVLFVWLPSFSLSIIQVISGQELRALDSSQTTFHLCSAPHQILAFFRVESHFSTFASS